MGVVIGLIAVFIAWKIIKGIWGGVRRGVMYEQLVRHVIDSSIIYGYTYCIHKILDSSHPKLVSYSAAERFALGYFFALGFAVAEMYHGTNITGSGSSEMVLRVIAGASKNVLRVLQGNNELLRKAYGNYVEMCGSNIECAGQVDFAEFISLLGVIIKFS